MADTKISALPSASALTGTEVVAGVQSAATVGITASQIKTFVGSGGSPGGANTQVQFNDGGAFAGSANMTWDKATNTLTVSGAKVGNTSIPSTGSMVLAPSNVGTWNTKAIQIGVGGAGINGFGSGIHFVSLSGGNTSILDGGVVLQSLNQLTWSANTDTSIIGDTGVARNVGGVIEVNNGNRGTYRDLKLRGVIFGGTFTVGTLPSASTAGDGAWYRVTDLTSPALGSAPAGSGSVHGTVTSNGSSYTVSQFG